MASYRHMARIEHSLGISKGLQEPPLTGSWVSAGLHQSISFGSRRSRLGPCLITTSSYKQSLRSPAPVPTPLPPLSRTRLPLCVFLRVAQCSIDEHHQLPRRPLLRNVLNLPPPSRQASVSGAFVNLGLLIRSTHFAKHPPPASGSLLFGCRPSRASRQGTDTSCPGPGFVSGLFSSSLGTVSAVASKGRASLDWKTPGSGPDA